MRERVEADLDRWLRPYEDALEATRAIVVGQGPQARLEQVPDHRTRIQAADAVLDRVYGRPKQTAGVAIHDDGARHPAPIDREEAKRLREAFTNAYKDQLPELDPEDLFPIDEWD